LPDSQTVDYCTGSTDQQVQSSTGELKYNLSIIHATSKLKCIFFKVTFHLYCTD